MYYPSFSRGSTELTHPGLEPPEEPALALPSPDNWSSSMAGPYVRKVPRVEGAGSFSTFPSCKWNGEGCDVNSLLQIGTCTLNSPGMEFGSGSRSLDSLRSSASRRPAHRHQHRQPVFQEAFDPPPSPPQTGTRCLLLFGRRQFFSGDKNNAAVLPRRGDLEEGPKGGLGSDTYDGLLLNSVHVDRI